MERTKLKVLRVSNKMTQSEMSTRLGVNITTYCHIENGKASGSIKFWLKVQKAFELSDDEVWAMQIEPLIVD